MSERTATESRKRAFAIRGATFTAADAAPGLYVVATPIGNLSDITLRALETLAGADIVACEDTRVTRKLLNRYAISAKVIAYHEHSSPDAHRRLLAALGEGKSVALVSDAGTPLLSDPGAALVVDAIAAGHAVIPIPGPSAAVTALAAAGLPTEAVLFLGFLPSKAKARRARLTEAAPIPATLALFESPNRIGALLVDAAATLGDDRRAVICRELTKLHETFERGTLGELAARFDGAAVKGEIVLLIAPPEKAPPPSEAEIDAMLLQALKTMSVKEAAAIVAAASGIARRSLYQRALALKGRQ